MAVIYLAEPVSGELVIPLDNICSPALPVVDDGVDLMRDQQLYKIENKNMHRCCHGCNHGVWYSSITVLVDGEGVVMLDSNRLIAWTLRHKVEGANGLGE